MTPEQMFAAEAGNEPSPVPAQLAYRNVRYARAERFAPAELLEFAGADPDAARGPIPPQLPSRLETVLGPQAPLDQSEDCQVLSVFTPSTSGRRPVMVWFHGGAYVSGGGELPWYDGDRLAADHDVVVVSVTARLGALGYLVGDDHEGPSPGTTDQLAALQWVRRNITEFGGDPENVTLFGQSAGGFAIEAMLRWGVPDGITGAIIQSGFLNSPDFDRSTESIKARSGAFRDLLSADPRSLSVTEVLAAQAEFGRQVGVPSLLPLRPVVGNPIAIPVVAGWTKEDTLPFALLQHGILQPTADDRRALTEVVRERNEREVVESTYDLLDEVVGNGAQAWAYEFAWDVPGVRWGAPHCMEIPLLLGSDDAWRDAPMLDGTEPAVLERAGARLRQAWSSFARHQDPGALWSTHSSDAKNVNDVGWV